MPKQGIVQRLSLREVELVAFQLAQEHLAFDEPIPDFSTRFPGVLESCSDVPFQAFFGKAAYASFISKASILFYLMVKNHPFQNGNKRIAVTVLLVFLLKNGKWVQCDWRQFYELTTWVAASPAQEKGFVVLAIEAFFRKHLLAAKDAGLGVSESH